MIKLWSLAVLAALFVAIGDASGPGQNIICYYNTKSHFRDGQAKFRVTDLEPALGFCTHLVYGFAGVNAESNKVVSLNEGLEMPAGQDNFRAITQIKRRYPTLKVLLSIGGGADTEETTKYLTLLESIEARTAFINSAHSFVRTYGFDGLDLAWEFPPNKPKKIRGTFSSLWHGIKKTFGTTLVDEKAAEHRDQFTSLVAATKKAFLADHLLLTLSVNPNVNSTVYYDVRKLSHDIDQVHLLAYDYYTPERNPKEADYTAPLYELIDRKPDENADFAVRFWTNNGAPANKVYLGVASFARTWKMNSDSAISGVPPLTIDGPGEEGPYTKEPGLLSYGEICTKINSPSSAKGGSARLRKIGDPTKRYGSYAFRLPDDSGEHGIWASYEDPDTIGYKAAYVKAKGLAGIAFVDVGLDDFRGLCSGDKYPLLRSLKNHL